MRPKNMDETYETLEIYACIILLKQLQHMPFRKKLPFPKNKQLQHTQHVTKPTKS
jgi:hypothetical protein